MLLWTACAVACSDSDPAPQPDDEGPTPPPDKEQQVVSTIHRLAEPDSVEIESGLALIAVVGRGMKDSRGTSARVFKALAKENINVKMIDQGSSELNIIVGVRNCYFKPAIKAIYDEFITSEDDE